MTEQEIVKECLKIVQAKRGFRSCRTTYDQMIAEGVQEELARSIEKHFGIENALVKADS